ncbi:hypothetical protein Tco_0320363 [Tanacetum coccineum]
MANLRYSDKHNMVAFLKKPIESVGFTEIVDFLKGTTLRYALIHNLTIYDSLVKQFWQTATFRTLANEIQELVASIDNKEYTITEASIRSKIQLADATGDHVPLLPAMLAGAAEDQDEGSAIPADSHHTPIDPVTSTSQPPILSTTEPSHSSPPRKIDRQDTEIPQSQVPTITPVADEVTTIGVGVETEGAATTTSGLDAGLDSGNIHESPLRSHEAPLPDGNTSGSAEDSLQLKELMAIVPKLVTRIDSLEKELKQAASIIKCLRLINDLNKKVAGIKKADSIKEESKEEEGTRKRKLGTRKKMKSRKRRFRQDTSEGDNTDIEKENDELRLCLTIALDEDKEVDYEILDKKYPIIEWKSEYLGIKPQYDETKDLEEININVVIKICCVLKKRKEKKWWSLHISFEKMFQLLALTDIRHKGLLLLLVSTDIRQHTRMGYRITQAV